MRTLPILGCLAWIALQNLAASLQAADVDPPAVVSTVPTANKILASFDQLSVLFSEPVTGVQATDLLINDIPAQSVYGGSNLWTFFFSQPQPGPVSVRWDINHTLVDLAGNHLDQTALGARWSGTLSDLTPPTALRIYPTPESVVSFLDGVDVYFSEPVDGVTPQALLLNGVPALSVQNIGDGAYRFSFTAPASTHLTLNWAVGNLIHDLSPAANSLVGGSWNYTVEPSVAAARVQINELMADNLSGLADEDGAAADWIELWNRGTAAVDLLGWGLSDDPLVPGKWIFPSVSLQPGHYLLVFASGKDRRPGAGGGPLHANFRLNSTGGTVILSDSALQRRTVDTLAYPEQRGDIAYGPTGGAQPTYLDPPTPGAPNANGIAYAGFVAPPGASVASGFFDRSFTVDLQSTTEGATLHYTLDGSVPTRYSPVYTGPLVITGRTNRAVATVRAVGFKAGMLPSNPSTFTYIFPDQVLEQPSNPAGFPTNWVSPGKATTTADYAMDRRVTTNEVYRPMIREGLVALPTVSLVTDERLLFEPAQGVYVQRESKNRQEAHVELILPDGAPGFSLDCGFEVQGGSSPTDSGSDWKSKNLSLRLVFSGDFGNKKLKYPLYPGGPVEEFDTLILDSALNMVWNHMTDSDQRNRGQYAREQFVNELMLRSAAQPPRGRFVHLYINGLYWGMKSLHERPEEKWAASYWGGDPSDYDVLKHTSDTVIAGSGTNYAAMLSTIRKPQSNMTNYVASLQLLDVDWFIDYMMVNFWAGNDDWDQHNWYAIRSRKPGSPGWRFVSWDAEHVLKDVNEDVSTILNSGSPSEIFTALRANPEFKLRWADHMQKHFFNGGMLYVDPLNREWNPAHPEWNRPAALYMQVINAIDPAIVCESARWGDVARPAQPYTRNVEWLRELQSLLFITNSPGNTTRYFPLRSSNVFTFFRRLGLYPTNAAAPSLAQHGGRVAPGFALTMAAAGPGTIYFTTDGNDPRVFRAGSPDPSATEYLPSSPPLLTTATLVKAHTLNGTNWSALTEARFEVGASDSPLRFSEIQYNPPGGDAFEFLELQNTGPLDLDLSGWSVEGIGFSFVPGTRLAAGGTLVLAPATDTNAWKLRYPGARIGGTFTGNLSNGGERLALVSPDGVVRLSMVYDDEAGWPTAADGSGRSLEIIDPNGDPGDPANWRASLQVNGSPGLPNTAQPAPSVQINEVLAENAGAITHAGTTPDYIELHNSGSSPAVLAGWSLSDNGDARRFVFPAATSIPAGGFLVIWCDTNSTPGLHSGFALHREGELISLYDAVTNRIDAVQFGQQVPNQSLGRSGLAWVLNQPTPGAANTAASSASQDELWINELMVKHLPGQQDWIELFNRNATAPVPVRNIAIRVGERTVRYGLNAFLPPQGFLQLIADSQPGLNHLDLHLPSDGTEISLLDAAGNLVGSQSVSAETPEGASIGSYPDGAQSRLTYFGNSTPGAANAGPVPYAGPLFNEVLARNLNSVPGPLGTHPGFIELQNPSEVSLTLDGLVIELDGGRGGAFAFPSGLTLPPHALLVVWCDALSPVSGPGAAQLNTGFALPARGGVLSLRDAQLAHLTLTYGFQIPDLSIGATAGSGTDWSLLSSPTPGAVNSGPASLGATDSIAINEWLASPSSGADWFELFNRNASPVRLDDLSVTDDPSIAGHDRAYHFPPLSYLAAHGYLKVIADGMPSDGPDHAPFRLSSSGGSLVLEDTSLPSRVDAVSYGLQFPDASQGRWPDGGEGIAEFLTHPTPEAPNGKAHPAIRINEFLLPDPGHTARIELFNSGDVPVDVGGWFLTDDPAQPRKLRLPGPLSIPARGYRLIDQVQPVRAGVPGLAEPLSIHPLGQSLLLMEADSSGSLSGYQSSLVLVPASFAIGPIETCEGEISAALIAATALAPNANPVDGPAGTRPTISTQPMDQTVVMGQTVEFVVVPSGPGPFEYQWFHNCRAIPGATGQLIEIREASQGNVGEYRVRVSAQGLCTFSRVAQLSVFPQPMLLSQPASQFVTPGKSVSFSVQASTENPPLRYQWLFNGAEILNENAATLAITNAQLASEGNYQVRVEDRRGSVTSLAARLTVRVKPVVTLQPSPVAQVVAIGSNATFTVSASGSLPMTFIWRKAGKATPMTNITLLSTQCVFTLPRVGTNDAGRYYVSVTNFGGSANPFNSQTATLAVVTGPRISAPPQDAAANPGGSATFTISAFGDAPMTYQWLHEGLAIPGAVGPTLQLDNVQRLDAGAYSVALTNPGSTVESAPGRLFVLDPMRLSFEQAGGMVTIRWVAVIGRRYRIESASDLSHPSWEPAGYERVSDSALGRFDVPLNLLEGERYWRLLDLGL